MWISCVSWETGFLRQEWHFNAHLLPFCLTVTLMLSMRKYSLHLPKQTFQLQKESDIFFIFASRFNRDEKQALEADILLS